MSPPPHISYPLLLPTTGLQVNTSSKPLDSYSTTGHHVPTSPYISFSTTNYYRSIGQHVIKTSKTLRFILYYRSPCHHLTMYLILYNYLLQVYRSTIRQNPLNHTNTTGHHVTTSPCISSSTTTYHRSTGQHVVKTPRIIPIPQVTMSPPRHISHSLLLPTTGLQVNTSSKPSKPYQYYRSAIFCILHFTSPKTQNHHNHAYTTGQHGTTPPYLV